MKQGKTIDNDGNTFYYKDDKLHRDNDLPAAEFATGSKWWYQNGKTHRDNDLPAIIYSSGTTQWFKDGKLYRLAGPAWITDTGIEFYFIDDKKLTKEEHANHPEVKKYKLQQILNKLTA